MVAIGSSDEPTESPVPMDSRSSEGSAQQPDRQEIRLAVVLNGGVSLAVWISGVTHELQPPRAGQPAADDRDARRLRRAARRAAGDRPDRRHRRHQRRRPQRRLPRPRPRARLRPVRPAHLWQDQGDLGILLRDPRQKNQPSLLRGEYFHEKLAERLRRRSGRTRTGEPAAPGEDVDLFLTGTLWEGRGSFFADDMGRRITEVDHDATFHFTSDPGVPPRPPTSDRARRPAQTARSPHSWRWPRAAPPPSRPPSSPSRSTCRPADPAAGRPMAVRRRPGQLPAFPVRHRRRHPAQQADPAGDRRGLPAVGRPAGAADPRLRRARSGRGRADHAAHPPA